MVLVLPLGINVRERSMPSLFAKNKMVYDLMMENSGKSQGWLIISTTFSEGGKNQRRLKMLNTHPLGGK